MTVRTTDVAGGEQVLEMVKNMLDGIFTNNGVSILNKELGDSILPPSIHGGCMEERGVTITLRNPCYFGFDFL